MVGILRCLVLVTVNATSRRCVQRFRIFLSSRSVL